MFFVCSLWSSTQFVHIELDIPMLVSIVLKTNRFFSKVIGSATHFLVRVSCKHHRSSSCGSISLHGVDGKLHEKKFFYGAGKASIL